MKTPFICTTLPRIGEGLFSSTISLNYQDRTYFGTSEHRLSHQSKHLAALQVLSSVDPTYKVTPKMLEQLETSYTLKKRRVNMKKMARVGGQTEVLPSVNNLPRPLPSHDVSQMVHASDLRKESPSLPLLSSKVEAVRMLSEESHNNSVVGDNASRSAVPHHAFNSAGDKKKFLRFDEGTVASIPGWEANSLNEVDCRQYKSRLEKLHTDRVINLNYAGPFVDSHGRMRIRGCITKAGCPTVEYSVVRETEVAASKNLFTVLDKLRTVCFKP